MIIAELKTKTNKKKTTTKYAFQHLIDMNSLFFMG